MALAVHVVSGKPEDVRTPLLGVLLSKSSLAGQAPSALALPASLQALDRKAGGGLSRLLAAGDFTGKRDETALLHPAEGPTRILLVGTGPLDVSPRTGLRRAASIFGRRATSHGAGTATLLLPSEVVEMVPPVEAAQVLAEGVHQGAWTFTDLKRPPEDPKAPLDRCDLLVPGGHEAAAWTDGARVGDAVGAGQSFARHLQVLPGNTCTPTYLARIASDLAAQHSFTATILDDAALDAEGMHALLAVGQGSHEPSRLIVLEYKGAKEAPTVLVGKGVSFDTGGISLKPGPNMEEMKYDMSGAAAVLGTFEALGRLRPKRHVVGIIPSAENMPSGTAYKPGDVIRSHFGKTIEIVNTDAEGRLLLADALSYARRFHPASVIDAATLTGAIVIGLGHGATGVMGTDDALVERIRAAGERAGERVWPLPLWDEYRDQLKSDIADLKNSGGRPAGSITAGWFLREFVEGFPWAHLDIAGTAYTDRDAPPIARGPTGVGVRLFLDLLIGSPG